MDYLRKRNHPALSKVKKLVENSAPKAFFKILLDSNAFGSFGSRHPVSLHGEWELVEKPDANGREMISGISVGTVYYTLSSGSNLAFYYEATESGLIVSGITLVGDKCPVAIEHRDVLLEFLGAFVKIGVTRLNEALVAIEQDDHIFDEQDFMIFKVTYS